MFFSISPSTDDMFLSSYVNFFALRMSDIVSRRQRAPWFWPDSVYNCFGEGREHEKTLKVLQSFTYKVSNGANIVWKSMFLQHFFIYLQCRRTGKFRRHLALIFHFLSGYTRKRREHFQRWSRQRLWRRHKEKTSISGHAAEDHIWGRQ